jgi:hypothetical protein
MIISFRGPDLRSGAYSSKGFKTQQESCRESFCHGFQSCWQKDGLYLHKLEW